MYIEFSLNTVGDSGSNGLLDISSPSDLIQLSSSIVNISANSSAGLAVNSASLPALYESLAPSIFIVSIIFTAGAVKRITLTFSSLLKSFIPSCDRSHGENVASSGFRVVPTRINS